MTDQTVIETNETNREMAVRSPMEAGGNIVPIIPRDLNEIARYADWIIKAAMIPASYEVKLPDAVGDADRARQMTQARIMIGIEKGLEVGMGPVTALSTIMIINNRPCVWGDGAIALCQQKNKVDWVKTWYQGDPDSDEWTAYFAIKRRGQEVPYDGSFSVLQAKRAKLWNNPQKRPWIEYPQRMLLARARAYALREGFADCLMGLGIAEEIQDIPAAPREAVSTSFLDDSTQISQTRTQDPESADITTEFAVFAAQYATDFETAWNAGPKETMELRKRTKTYIDSLLPDQHELILSIEEKVRLDNAPADQDLLP